MTGVTSFTYGKNIELIGQAHACVGCVGKEQRAATHETAEWMVGIPDRLEHESNALFAALGTAKANLIEAFIKEHDLPDNMIAGLMFLSSYNEQVHTVDQLRGSRNPLIRGAYLLQAIKVLAACSVHSTVEQALEELPENEDEIRELGTAVGSLMVDAAFDGGPTFAEWSPIMQQAFERADDPDAADDDKIETPEGMLGFLESMLDSLPDGAEKDKLRTKLDFAKKIVGLPVENIDKTTLRGHKMPTNGSGMVEVEPGTSPEDMAAQVRQSIIDQGGPDIPLETLVEQLGKAMTGGIGIIKMDRKPPHGK